MKLHIVAIRDSASDSFSQPQFVPSLGGFIRGFGDEVNRQDAGNNLFNHPEHFELFHLGSFESDTADFEIFAKPLSLAIAANFKK